MKVYIAGKISGLPMEEVREKFEAAKTEIRGWGYEPVSPLDNGCDSDCWCEQMMACLPMLLGCGGIYLLDNWRDSDGAKVEMLFARKRGMYVVEDASSYPTNKIWL